MGYEQREGQGSLFVNDRKQSETHADYQGSIMVGGVEYWLNGWKKETRDGKRWLSLSMKPKQPRADSQGVTDDDMADIGEDIPW